MTIKSFIAPIALSTAMLAAPANANLLFDIYAGATVGVGGATVGTEMFDSNKQDSFSAQSYGAVIGFDIPVLRFEAEYNMLNIDSDIHAHMAMANIYVKMPGLVVVNPYIGAGVGAALDVTGGHNISATNHAAYQAMAGLTFDIPTLPIKIDAEARALYAPDFVSIDHTDKTLDALHYDLRLKLRYIF